MSAAPEYHCTLCDARWRSADGKTFTADKRCYSSPRNEPMKQDVLDQLVDMKLVEKVE